MTAPKKTPLQRFKLTTWVVLNRQEYELVRRKARANNWSQRATLQVLLMDAIRAEMTKEDGLGRPKAYPRNRLLSKGGGA